MNFQINQKGLTLIEIMISVSILGIVSLVLMTIFNLFNSTHNRANLVGDADELARMIQAVMDRPELCKHALRSSGNNLIRFDGSQEVNVTTIVAVDPSDPSNMAKTIRIASMVADGSHRVNPQLYIKRIFVRPGGTPSSNIMIRKGGSNKPYRAHIAQLVVEFFKPGEVPGSGLPKIGSPGSGGSIKDLVLPVRIASAASGPPTVDECSVVQVSLKDVKCDQDIVQDCAGAPPATGCTKIYFVAGFDVNGTPDCRCQWSCGAGSGSSSNAGGIGGVDPTRGFGQGGSGSGPGS